MALNYDPVNSRLKVFRFPHGNNLESLKRERPEDVLDIEEFGKYHRAKVNSRRRQYGTLFLLGVYCYTLTKQPSFNSMNPLARSFLTAGVSLAVLIQSSYRERAYVNQVLEDFLIQKTLDTYEDPITVKYKTLTN